MPPPTASATASASVKLPVPAAVPASPQQPAAPICTAAEIDTRLDAWIANPGDAAARRAAIALSEGSGTCSVEVTYVLKNVPAHDAVSAAFWAKNAMMPREAFITFVRGVIKGIGSKASNFEREIVVTAIANEPKPVRDAIEEELLQLPRAEVDSGRRDSAFVKLCLTALVRAREKECASDTACHSRHEKLRAAHDQYSSLFGVSLGFTPRYYGRMLGEPLAQIGVGGQLAIDWIGAESSPGRRPMVGGVVTAGPGMLQVGARAGVGNSDGATVNLEAGYLRLAGLDKERKDVPIQLDNPPVTADGSAYRVRTHDVDRILNAGYLALNVEGATRLTRTSPFSIYYGFMGGLFGGSVRDAECSYSVDPGKAAMTARPSGAGAATITSSVPLDSRCRNSEFVFGTMWGAGAGVRGRF